jgi:hypothetical protein
MEESYLPQTKSVKIDKQTKPITKKYPKMQKVNQDPKGQLSDSIDLKELLELLDHDVEKKTQS